MALAHMSGRVVEFMEVFETTCVREAVEIPPILLHVRERTGII